MYYCSLAERGAERGAQKLAGVNISIFMAHSTRNASASAAADSGITSSDILKADWSTKSVFRKLYYRPTYEPLYGRTVLSSGSSETYSAIIITFQNEPRKLKLHNLK